MVRIEQLATTLQERAGPGSSGQDTERVAANGQGHPTVVAEP